MKKSNKSILIAIAITFTGSMVYAQHDHAKQEPKEENHHVGEVGKGPHGGTIQEADPYHAEVAFNDGNVMFYPLTGEAKPMSNAGVIATATLQGADGKTSTITLTPSGDDGFAAKGAKADFKNAVVTFKIKDKSVTAKFKGGKSSFAMMYQCPMHPEEQSMSPAKCSKCGMDMVMIKKSGK